jgi:hypothetical protein
VKGIGLGLMMLAISLATAGVLFAAAGSPTELNFLAIWQSYPSEGHGFFSILFHFLLLLLRSFFEGFSF